MTHAELVRRARAMRRRAYAPYSRYRVGAALLSADGRVFLGCNVENASYGLTVCAERTAYFQAIAAGDTRFVALAVATENGGSPCGACLQVAREFGPDLVVLIAGARGKPRVTTLAALLPLPYVPGATRGATAPRIRTRRSR